MANELVTLCMQHHCYRATTRSSRTDEATVFMIYAACCLMHASGNMNAGGKMNPHVSSPRRVCNLEQIMPAAENVRSTSIVVGGTDFI